MYLFIDGTSSVVNTLYHVKFLTQGSKFLKAKCFYKNRSSDLKIFYFLTNTFVKDQSVAVLNIRVWEFRKKMNGKRFTESFIRVSTVEFYPENPISLFYINREFESFWIGNQKKLQSLTSIIGEAELHGHLPHVTDELNQQYLKATISTGKA